MAKMYGKGGKTAIESEEQQKLRWQVELEFVQCLANPNYLNFLAQRGYFKDQAFINYLKYLQYWKEPEYAKYLMYPMCLYFLDLLQYEHFRREIVNSQCCKFIDDQAILQWQHYTRKRIKMFNSVNNTQMNAAATCGTEINEAQQPQMAAQQPGSNSAAGVNIQNGNTGVNTQQAQLVGSQQQSQQMNGTNSVNPLMQKMQ
uniref:Mediator of RNA polymerase II transcription subunit 31 n=1 Tax=Glossina morsitans morsitans TaxID=37546 RepID=A0A1B0FQN0_GLOMM